MTSLQQETMCFIHVNARNSRSTHSLLSRLSSPTLIASSSRPPFCTNSEIHPLFRSKSASIDSRVSKSRFTMILLRSLEVNWLTRGASGFEGLKPGSSPDSRPRPARPRPRSTTLEELTVARVGDICVPFVGWAIWKNCQQRSMLILI
ncbi:hypothetical protein OGATHE_004245 [Ogataea polymorpha]|uniref:Uncharacterized protein n=1 Tax=Ogataea polymorpha TaxID=460523 RepID=A0A9P8NZQ5_9ASCO|nr:hypothetical protein OGATHE_004245 [Ogataea polymorpha]